MKAVTALAFDSTGETLATGSADGSVFFFNVSNKSYAPIGFVPVAGPVTHIAWSPAAYVSGYSVMLFDLIRLVIPMLIVDYDFGVSSCCL